MEGHFSPATILHFVQQSTHRMWHLVFCKINYNSCAVRAAKNRQERADNSLAAYAIFKCRQRSRLYGVEVWTLMCTARAFLLADVCFHLVRMSWFCVNKYQFPCLVAALFTCLLHTKRRQSDQSHFIAVVTQSKTFLFYFDGIWPAGYTRK